MITLLRGGEVFSPKPLGPRDILMAGERILAVAEPGSISMSGVEVDEIDVSGLSVLPGMVDSHVHLIGGGGEGGPATRTPEIRVEEIVGNGVTTVLGAGEIAISDHRSAQRSSPKPSASQPSAAASTSPPESASTRPP